ncbi:sodium-coupled monocarboxylate transporter 1-like [Brachionus plicatilis]|uniref:Sodium-coupled monocarboxylate transporter 1-like n=1 Tax=Brachionus plicatilis TaxID=10195 RepID=A0A3M7S7K8_BRAPC|nr:sodium-coupled monocarboxylate transporter 1-like [Brachionus plicatilis]
MIEQIDKFHYADYIVFVGLLMMSALIGISIGWMDRKKNSTQDYLLGGGDLKIFPIGISILGSFISAVAILGVSSEMYQYGTLYWTVIFSYPITLAVAGLVFAPLFHRLRITSAYEFLYMSVALYSPSLAIEQVTGIPLFYSIIGTGGICALYTVAGGLKGTVWIDTFQVGVMFIGFILKFSIVRNLNKKIQGLTVLIIKGIIEIPGGLSEVWRRAEQSDRIEFFDFNPSPFVRHTTWALFFGSFFTDLTVYGANQGSIQRYMAVRKWQYAAKALLVNLVGVFFLQTLICLCGLIAYAKYYDCDILSTGTINKGEQILSFLVLDILGQFHGFPGLFVATIYSAALSTISTGMNSLAAVCITDFVKPFYQKKYGISLTEKKATFTSKAIALFFGLAAIGMAFSCQFFGSTVMQLTSSIFGLLGGPLLGVISLGMFVKKANWVGAIVGLILSTIGSIYLGVIGVLYNKPSGLKPVSTIGCNITTTTTTKNLTSPIEYDDGPFLSQLSYLYYSLCACIITYFFGIVISVLVEKMKWIEIKPIKSEYLFSLNVWNDNKVGQNKVDVEFRRKSIELSENNSIKF